MGINMIDLLTYQVGEEKAYVSCTTGSVCPIGRSAYAAARRLNDNRWCWWGYLRCLHISRPPDWRLGRLESSGHSGGQQ